jgi:hypothetical protein
MPARGAQGEALRVFTGNRGVVPVASGWLPCPRRSGAMAPMISL